MSSGNGGAGGAAQGTRGGIGQRVVRLEDRALLTGDGRFVDDIAFDHQLHMRVVRSPVAHGRLVGIDVAAALAHPGIVAVWTGEDTADVAPIDYRDPSAQALVAYRQPVLARGTVRYVGEPIAVVFGEDPYAAEDAANLVLADIEPLQPIMSAAVDPGPFAAGRSTEATVLECSFGDCDTVLAASAAVIEATLMIGRHSAVPMETRGAIGVYDPGRDLLKLFGAAKVPHRNRETLVRMLNRAPSGVHLYEGHTGGGFGARGELYPEDVLVLVAAMRLRRPVKWVEDRREHLVATNHSREQIHTARMGFAADGRILAFDDTIMHDQGGYIRTHGTRVLDFTLRGLAGPYRIDAFRGRGHFRLTNKTPAATYRAPGGYESTFVREVMIERAARRLGIDRIDLRRRNFVRSDEMPFHRPYKEAGAEDLLLDSGDFGGLLDKVLERLRWQELEPLLARRRAAGELAGAGFSCFFDESGRGPADGARITVDVSGDVEVVTGGASVGQGFETVMAQIAAEALGVDYDRIRVVHGQTDRIAHGIGAHASRATVLTGNAVHAAASKVRGIVVGYASELLQLPSTELRIVGGVVSGSSGRAGPSIGIDEIARRVAPGSPLLAGRDPGLSAEGWHSTDRLAFACGVHAAVARVDRDTGQVVIERYVIAHEVGRAVNPMMVEGQVVGGCAQGIGGALYEEYTYAASGDPLSASFADYLMPTAVEVPQIEVIISEEQPSPVNPLGLKGSGEGGINGVGAAIANAVDDALGGHGIVAQLPITPQRVRGWLAEIERVRTA